MQSQSKTRTKLVCTKWYFLCLYHHHVKSSSMFFASLQLKLSLTENSNMYNINKKKLEFFYGMYLTRCSCTSNLDLMASENWVTE